MVPGPASVASPDTAQVQILRVPSTSTELEAVGIFEKAFPRFRYVPSFENHKLRRYVSSKADCLGSNLSQVLWENLG